LTQGAGSRGEKRRGLTRSCDRYVEIEAPDDGVLKGIKAQEGDFVKFSGVVALSEKAG
jgi:hypothetical protein